MKKALLKIYRNGEWIRDQEFTSELLLGRDSHCDLQMDDPAISMEHARFRLTEHGLEVIKLSEFGTFEKNGQTVAECLVSNGDILLVGPFEVHCEVYSGERSQVQGPIVESTNVESQPLASPAFDSPQVQPMNVESEFRQNDSPEEFSIEIDNNLQAQSERPAEDIEVNLNLDSPEPMQLEVAQEVIPESMQESIDSKTKSKIEEIPDIIMGGGAASEQNLADPISEPEEIVAAEEQVLKSQGIEHVALESSQKVEPRRTGNNPVTGSFRSKTGRTGTRTNTGTGTGTNLISNKKYKAQLIFGPGSANVTIFEITKDRISIGRSSDCDIILTDKKSSRRHTEVHRSGLKFKVVDLGSVNGTFLNGEKISEADLSGDDVLRIGDTEFQFQVTSLEYEERKDQFISPPPESTFSRMSPLATAQAPSLQSVGGTQSLRMTKSLGGYQTGVSFPGMMTGGGGNGAAQDPPRSLWGKFKNHPRRKQMVIGFALAALVFDFLFEDSLFQSPSQNGTQNAQSKDPGIQTFEKLDQEKKSFVKTQYQLARDLYTKGEYEKALFELQKIFQIIPDYLDAKDLEKYAQEGVKRLERNKEIRLKEEEEAKVKAKIAELIEQTQQTMAAKEYDKAAELFNEIIALDPENEKVNEWKKELEDLKAEQERILAEKRLKEEVAEKAKEMFAQGAARKKAGRCLAAIDRFSEVIELGPDDKKLISKSKNAINDCRRQIASVVAPVIEEGKRLEGTGDTLGAYRAYREALKSDPRNAEAKLGINRLSDILQERAKGAFTEAILAESYSDFETAKKKYEECLKMVPEDNVYYQRAKRKLTRFLQFETLEGKSSQ